MTIRITDALVGEHGPLYRQLDRLQDAARGSAAQMRSCAHLLAAGLASHAHLEDSLLFAAVEQRTGLDGMLEDMYDEHRRVDELLAELAACESDEEAQATALRLVTLARNHFAKEEHAVFRHAEQTLGEAELVRLGEVWQYARLETPFALRDEP